MYGASSVTAISLTLWVVQRSARTASHPTTIPTATPPTPASTNCPSASPRLNEPVTIAITAVR